MLSLCSYRKTKKLFVFIFVSNGIQRIILITNYDTCLQLFTFSWKFSTIRNVKF